MSKQQLNVRISELTRQELDELCAQFGMSEGEIVTLAVDRLHQSGRAKMFKVIEWCERGDMFFEVAIDAPVHEMHCGFYWRPITTFGDDFFVTYESSSAEETYATYRRLRAEEMAHESDAIEAE